MSLTMRSFVPALCGLLIGVVVTPMAFGQQIFRSVSPDGRQTFSDKQPLTGEAQPTRTAAATATSGGPALPFALRQVTGQYPVVLYTGENCAPCVTARNYLVSRGIPFAEKTVGNNNDLDALQRLSRSTTLPLLTIGAQQLKGFAETEWLQYLDAAGYPKTSQLPPGYKNPPAAPVVAAQKKTIEQATSRPAEEPTAAAPAPTPAADQPVPPNPTGIRF